MKKLFYALVALLALSVTSVSAQQKGDIYVGGDLGFSVSSVSVSGESVTATEFGIQPSVVSFSPIDSFWVSALDTMLQVVTELRIHSPWARE